MATVKVYPDHSLIKYIDKYANENPDGLSAEWFIVKLNLNPKLQTTILQSIQVHHLRIMIYEPLYTSIAADNILPPIEKNRIMKQVLDAYIKKSNNIDCYGLLKQLLNPERLEVAPKYITKNRQLSRHFS